MKQAFYSDNLGKGIKIVILDSGLDKSSYLVQSINFTGGIGFSSNNNEIICRNNICDDIGHGTAIASIIHKLVPEAQIIPIKIIENGIMNDESVLINALYYIDENIECDVINISIGLLCCAQVDILESICERLSKKGVIIVAAFDNGGTISYPAAFDCVIGIDSWREAENKDIFYKADDERVDYIGINREQRVPWINGKMQMVSGNSFIAPYFTAKVAQIQENKKRSLSEVKTILDESAVSIVNFSTPAFSSLEFTVTKAITFPFNKEVHSLARYSDYLDFNIVGFYDSKYTGQIGKSIKSIIGDNIHCEERYIQNINDVDWNSDFDTVILGHVTELSQICGKDYEKEIIEKCCKYHKKLYSMKDIRKNKALIENEIEYYCPYIDPPNGSIINKMFSIGKPVLGVVGTSSRQGKFSLQIELRHEFKKVGYSVGFLGTEPTSALFGVDEVFPMGYESAVYTKGLTSVYAVNHLMGRIESKQPDIIMFGSQSHTIPKYTGGLQHYPVVQHELLLGCQADAYILCVSAEDPVDYIERTISYLEGIYPSKVIALALSPLESTLRWSVLSHKKNLISKEVETKALDNIKKVLNLPVYSWNDKEQLQELVATCINYFSE